MKEILLLIISAALLYAGSDTAVSNRFSLGKPANAIANRNTGSGKSSAPGIKLKWTGNGMVFTLGNAGTIHSLSIINSKGVVVKVFRQIVGKTVLWNGCGSRGKIIPEGCYIVRVNERYARTFVLFGRDGGK